MYRHVDHMTFGGSMKGMPGGGGCMPYGGMGCICMSCPGGGPAGYLHVQYIKYNSASGLDGMLTRCLHAALHICLGVPAGGEVC
jgi:hypothetical protein